jgi:hypothetical protein
MTAPSEAVAAVMKLNPHPECYARARWVPERDRYEFPIIKKPLTPEIAELHVRGKTILGAVASDADGKTNNVGLDLDAHFAEQNPAKAARRFVQAAQALDVPVIIHASKSGKGAHIRTIFSERVPTFIARALYIALVITAGLNGEKAVDKVWPPSHGLGVLALPYNAQCAKAVGGTLALDPNTLRPLARDAQVASVLDTEEMSREQAEATLRHLNVLTEIDAAILSGAAKSNGKYVDPTRAVREGTDGGIQEMMYHCHAVDRLRDEATLVSYEFWFGMMTNFRPFIGGKEIFTALSQLDASRFEPKVLERSWKAIAGGPRMCAHLDTSWTCPLFGTCPAKSPAGLPFAVKRAQRAMQAEQGQGEQV